MSSYEEILEDALLFVREKQQLHQWERTGIWLDGAEGYEQLYCKICGGNNWRRNEGTAICFGSNEAEKAVIHAHNRRAGRLYEEAMEERRKK